MWYKRFAMGINELMGDIASQDHAYTIDVFLKLLKMNETEWECVQYRILPISNVPAYFSSFHPWEACVGLRLCGLTWPHYGIIWPTVRMLAMSQPWPGLFLGGLRPVMASWTVSLFPSQARPSLESSSSNGPRGLSITSP